MWLASWTLMSCEEYREGCMDANATNFQVSNQVPCCCEYPSIIFQTTLTHGGQAAGFTDTFTNFAGQRFIIRDLRFVASGISLRDSLDRIFTPTDTFQNYAISPDILAVDVLNLNSTGADFLFNGQFRSLEFELDMPGSLADKVPRNFEVDHPFRDSSFYDFQRNEWYIFNTTLEVLNQGLLQIELTQTEFPIPIRVTGEWTKRRGADLTVHFRMDVETLMGDIDFEMGDDAIRSQIAKNLPGSFEP
ncbi:MAG TPA: hypothetical protein VKZ56_11255 [Membranihabitans sp.]|nr:hypothetical protein [Membranihabitans sp.]